MAAMSAQISGLWQRLSRQSLRLQFFFILLLKGRVSLRKLANLFANERAYRKLSPIAGAAPAVVLFDTTNRCNLFCRTCRRSQNDVVDLSGQTEKPVALAEMTLERYAAIVNDLQRELLLATLYVSGEPLLNREIVAMVAHTSTRGVGSMISTNGMLLGEEISRSLLEADLDYLKVAISGLTQDVYGVYHQGGDIGTVLANLANFERLRRGMGKRCMVVLDYILFEHNRHQLDDARRFCTENGIGFSLRYGRTLDGTGLVSPAESRTHYLPKTKPCDWLWKIMVFCADGRAVPCCQFTTCAESPFVMGMGGETTTAEIWNGNAYRELRLVQAKGGRKGLPLCESCFYSDIDFQS